jgi:hypothetical protein
MATQVDESRGRGWIEFAAVLVFAAALFRIIAAIGAFESSHKIIDLRHGVFGNQFWVWGLWDLAIAILGIVVGVSLLRGKEFGRHAGYAWSVLVILHGFTVIGLAPTYGTISIVIAGLVVYALSQSHEAEP